MKYSGIGGQAVMEGVMMKNQNRYAVAVRKPDGEIIVEKSQYGTGNEKKKIKKLPILRGVFNFVESLVLGMKTLNYSASFFEEEEKEKENTEKESAEKENKERENIEEETSDKERRQIAQKEKKKEDFLMGVTVAAAIVLAVGIFLVLPYYISLFFQQFITSSAAIALLEGLIRLLIFVGYVGGISLMPEIRRVYMYHGAEHKCINCIENGMELNVENVRKSSRLHKRCGTSFLLIVMLISILFFMVIQVRSVFFRLLLRLLFIPVIAGVSYEFIRLAGRSDNFFVNLLSKPGLFLQKLTTREPEDAMIEVGIASVEAVFDWRAYLEEMRKEAV